MSRRVNCKAAVKMKKKGKEWIYEKVLLKHSHTLNPDACELKHIRSHKNKDPVIMELIDDLQTCDVSPNATMNVLTRFHGNRDLMPWNERDLQNRKVENVRKERADDVKKLKAFFTATASAELARAAAAHVLVPCSSGPQAPSRWRPVRPPLIGAAVVVVLVPRPPARRGRIRTRPRDSRPRDGALSARASGASPCSPMRPCHAASRSSGLHLPPRSWPAARHSSRLYPPRSRPVARRARVRHTRQSIDAGSPRQRLRAARPGAVGGCLGRR
ncbi:hypothetical protein ZWY2020_029465 [Hordeum vulgare]|nr:hypothetical protein ZWY2020_029465 [Hordeum vulgare]